MLCESCNKNSATIHLTEIVDSQRKEMHLCETCAMEQGIAAQAEIPLKDLLANLLASAPKEVQEAGFDLTKACPNCGITLEQFTKKGQLGCALDYEFFSEELKGLIEKAHDGATSHSGKVPSKVGGDAKKQMDVLRLKEELDKAVKKEDYEQAAKLRDSIHKLEQGDG